MKYQIYGCKDGTIVKNYKVNSYYVVKKFKLKKKYHLKINYIKGKSGNLYTYHMEDVNEVIENLEIKMLKQIKALVSDSKIIEESAKMYADKNSFIFAKISNAVTVLMPIITSIAYKNAANLLFVFPNLAAKIYYTFYLHTEWKLCFYDDIEKYKLYLDNQNIVDINELDKINLQGLTDKIEEKRLIKRR